ncbi:MAG: hypothetical protein ACP5I3_09620, partial [Thermoproteus sp.]
MRSYDVWIDVQNTEANGQVTRVLAPWWLRFYLEVHWDVVITASFGYYDRYVSENRREMDLRFPYAYPTDIMEALSEIDAD